MTNHVKGIKLKSNHIELLKLQKNKVSCSTASNHQNKANIPAQRNPK